VSESKGKKWVDHELLHEGAEFDEAQEKKENSSTTWLREKLCLEAFVKHDLIQQKEVATEASNAMPFAKSQASYEGASLLDLVVCLAEKMQTVKLNLPPFSVSSSVENEVNDAINHVVAVGE
jgi:hypothetical protein